MDEDFLLQFKAYFSQSIPKKSHNEPIEKKKEVEKEEPQKDY